MGKFSPKTGNRACQRAGNQEPSFRKISIQWNIRGLRGSLPELQLMLAEERHLPLTLALQETLIDCSKANSTPLKSYHFYHQAGPSLNKGGVCLAVLQNIPHKLINITTELQICAVSIEGPQKLTLASIYIPPHHNNNNLKQELSDTLKQLPPPFILMGDFNASHTLWGSETCNCRGKIILEVAEIHNIIILNNQLD